jgi:hypothetical protein
LISQGVISYLGGRLSVCRVSQFRHELRVENLLLMGLHACLFGLRWASVFAVVLDLVQALRPVGLLRRSLRRLSLRPLARLSNSRTW